MSKQIWGRYGSTMVYPAFRQIMTDPSWPFSLCRFSSRTCMQLFSMAKSPRVLEQLGQRSYKWDWYKVYKVGPPKQQSSFGTNITRLIGVDSEQMLIIVRTCTYSRYVSLCIYLQFVVVINQLLTGIPTVNQHWSYMFGHCKNLSGSQGVYPSQKNKIRAPAHVCHQRGKLGTYITNSPVDGESISRTITDCSLNPQTNLQFGMTMP